MLENTLPHFMQFETMMEMADPATNKETCYIGRYTECFQQ